MKHEYPSLSKRWELPDCFYCARPGTAENRRATLGVITVTVDGAIDREEADKAVLELAQAIVRLNRRLDYQG